MNQEEKFYSYLTKLSEQTKNPIVESIIKGFTVLSGYSPIVENEDQATNDTNTETIDTSNAENTMSDDISTGSVMESDEQATEPTEAVSEPTEIVKSETVAPELLDKVTKLCNEVLSLYKHLAGTDFVKEEIKQDDTKSEESPNTDTVKEPIMEEVNLGQRKATGDYTGTDYSKAFDSLFTFLNDTEKHIESMYRINKVDSQDQILAQTIPHIDNILNTYKAEFQQMEEQHMDNMIPVIRTTISASATKWIQVLKKFDIKLNQQHEIPDYYGRYVVAKFINDVVTPAIDYSEMIRGQMSVNDNKLQVNVKAIMDKISALVQTFDADVESDIKAKTGGKAYTKGATQAQPQAVSA